MKLFLIMMYHHDISSTFFCQLHTETQHYREMSPLTRKDYEKYIEAEQDLFSCIPTNIMRAMLFLIY